MKASLRSSTAGAFGFPALSNLASTATTETGTAYQARGAATSVSVGHLDKVVATQRRSEKLRGVQISSPSPTTDAPAFGLDERLLPPVRPFDFVAARHYPIARHH